MTAHPCHDRTPVNKCKSRLPLCCASSAPSSLKGRDSPVSLQARFPWLVSDTRLRRFLQFFALPWSVSFALSCSFSFINLLPSPPSMPRMLLKREDHLCEGHTTLSDHPQSELTFSGPAGGKKRPYMALSHHSNLLVQNRLYGSAGATNSGQPAAVTGSPMLSEDFISSLYRQNVDTDVLVRHQMESLKSGMEILRRKHCRDLLSVVQQQAAKRLRVKDVELETLNRRNMELEEQVRQMSDECQVWFNYAKTTETAISGLREKLDQVLTHQNAFPSLEEGYGDNVDQFPAAGDAESVYQADVDTELRGNRRVCRVCQEREACVLLLPCRHLCLCKSCEPMIDNCPLCSSARNASIQVVVP